MPQCGCQAEPVTGLAWRGQRSGVVLPPLSPVCQMGKGWFLNRGVSEEHPQVHPAVA